MGFLLRDGIGLFCGGGFCPSFPSSCTDSVAQAFAFYWYTNRKSWTKDIMNQRLGVAPFAGPFEQASEFVLATQEYLTTGWGFFAGPFEQASEFVVATREYLRRDRAFLRGPFVQAFRVRAPIASPRRLRSIGTRMGKSWTKGIVNERSPEDEI
jgi:hypothetical protein